MKRLLMTALLLACAASQGAAAPRDKGNKGDKNERSEKSDKLDKSDKSDRGDRGDISRVERVVYAENQVVRIAGIIDQPFLIELRNDDIIDDVAGGSIAGWDVHKKGNRLFIRALTQAKPTTLLVTAGSRSYVFDLLPKKATPEALAQRRSKIVFDYPAPAGPALPPLPGRDDFRNDNYSMQVVAEGADIRPREVFDNGRFTWFKFPNNQEVPAIYRSELNSKEEILVNSHRDGDYIVVHALAPLWNLRLAESMVGIFNESYNAQGVAPVNGTTVYGLSRESKQ
ncbi:TrbG/VirB9 family P-type conjugative transfer protein [Oxalobacteraceae bacterium]|nr:TrbG/VirB9 family P-type conjugative transfer protein [Oxalobacteraceae bacterium]